jgi:hypothetical protein
MRFFLLISNNHQNWPPYWKDRPSTVRRPSNNDGLRSKKDRRRQMLTVNGQGKTVGRQILTVNGLWDRLTVRRRVGTVGQPRHHWFHSILEI